MNLADLYMGSIPVICFTAKEPENRRGHCRVSGFPAFFYVASAGERSMRRNVLIGDFFCDLR